MDKAHTGTDGGYNSHPEYTPGRQGWSDAKRAEVGAYNMQVIAAAKQRQDRLEAMGGKYNKRNGTWSLPDGRTTTLMDNDPGPPGTFVTHNWGQPIRAWGEGDQFDQDEEEQRGPYGDKMPRAEDLPNYGFFGWIIGAFKRARGG